MSRNTKNQRRARKQALSREDCPTPGKWVWFTEAQAQAHAKKTGNMIYRCPGQAVEHYHVTSRKVRV